MVTLHDADACRNARVDILASAPTHRHVLCYCTACSAVQLVPVAHCTACTVLRAGTLLCPTGYTTPAVWSLLLLLIWKWWWR